MALCLLLTGCTGAPGNKNSQTETPDSAPTVGGDTDEHGCKASAGYQWSVVKNECVRLFEAGIRLDPKAEGLDTTLSAFAVFKSFEEDAQAEIFIPGQSASILLDKTGTDDAGTWKNTAYTLSQYRGMYTLDDANGKTLYQGSAN